MQISNIDIMMTKVASIILALLSTPSVAGKSPELNPASFVEAVQSSNAFMKFYAPWCGHCKALAPDWDALADEYSSSNSVIIGSIDCTNEDNSELCNDSGVQGYPTLKYYIDGNLEGEDYQGARSFEALKSFVDETLNKKCVVGSDDEMAMEDSNCSEKEQEYARKMRSKSAQDKKAQIDRLEKMKNSSMKPELKAWLMQRLNILKGLESLDMANDEF